MVDCVISRRRPTCAGAQTLKSMTRAQAHLMLAECDLLDALEANEKKEKNNEQ